MRYAVASRVHPLDLQSQPSFSFGLQISAGLGRAGLEDRRHGVWGIVGEGFLTPIPEHLLSPICILSLQRP